MQVVIDIPEEIYIHLLQRYKYQNADDIGLSELDKVGVSIKNGITLPKGYGDLVDRACLYDFREWLNTCPSDCDADDEIWFTSTEVINKIKQYPAVIEKDKEEEV